MTTPQRLYDGMIQSFDLEELQTLCFQVGIPYEDLPAIGREGKIREAIEWCQRQGKAMLGALVMACFNARPNLYWDEEVKRVPIATQYAMREKMNTGATNRLMGLQLAQAIAQQVRIEGRVNMALAFSGVSMAAQLISLAKG